MDEISKSRKLIKGPERKRVKFIQALMKNRDMKGTALGSKEWLQLEDIVDIYIYINIFS